MMNSIKTISKLMINMPISIKNYNKPITSLKLYHLNSKENINRNIGFN